LILGLLAIAFSVRCLYVTQYRKDVFFDFPIIDSATYDRMALDYAHGKPLWNGAFWQPPLYPWFLGVLYKLIGHSPFGVRIVQALVGAFSCLVLYGIARKVFSHSVGAIAAGAMALYGPLVYFDAELLPTNLYLFLLLSALLLLLHAANTKRRASWALWFSAGLALGLAALARSDVALFLCLAVGWTWWVSTGSWRTRLAHSSLILLGVGLAVLPVTFRNYRVARDFVLISSNGGLNFYLGNNPEAQKTVAIRPGFAWESLVNEPYLRAGIEKASGRSSYFFQKGLSFLRSDPKAALRLYAEKFGRFWNSFEIGRNRDVYSTREDSWLLSILLWRMGPFGFPFGLLAPFACAGLIACFSSDHSRVLLYLFVLAYIVVVVIFFVASRYRAAIVPVLILFAVQYVLWLVERVRRRNLRPVVLSLAPLALSFAGVNRGFPALDLVYRGETDRYLGVYHTDRSQPKEAEEAYRRAIALDPDYAEAHAELGQLFQAQGRHQEALFHLRRANELAPFSEQTHYLIGTAYAPLGYPKEAERCFRRAIAMAPHARAYRDLGVLMLDQERLDEAERLLLEARRLNANDLDTWYKLGQCHFLQGRYSDAERALSEALRLAPGDTEIIEKIRSLRIIMGQRP
jgi:tetratricopeptide (TPR) repeat protein